MPFLLFIDRGDRGGLVEEVGLWWGTSWGGRVWGVESGWGDIEDGEVTGVCKDTTNVVFNLLGEKSLF